MNLNMRVHWEGLVEASAHKIFNSHLWQNFDIISRKAEDTESILTMFCTYIAEAAV